MTATLRPYQQAQADAVMSALDGGIRRVLYTAATGTGKTVTMAEIVRRLLARGEQVLILAHRREIIEQTYRRVRAHCGLDEMEIAVEQASLRAGPQARVVVGSVQSCMRPDRPAGWRPSVIFVDEAHHAAARAQYQAIFARFSVPEACLLIGCTATAKRSDRSSLYAEGPDGSPVMLEDRRGLPRPAARSESVFDRLVYEYGIQEAADEGWLVPARGLVVETSTSLDGIATRRGDFAEGQLAERVDNLERTNLAISAWMEAALDRQTIVFCASVEHAHHAAKLWRDAGFTAAAVDGGTDSWTRHDLFRRFADGSLQVLCNMGIATEGVDVPACSAIVHLRPTKSWALYVQMTGRGLRTLPGVVDGLDDAEARRAAIAASSKRDCIVFDVVDIYSRCGELCTVPAILDLPVQLDLEGHSILEAQELLREHEEVRERVIGECPRTFTQLAARLRAVNLMDGAGARTGAHWRATDEGYRYTGLPAGYECDLVPADGSRPPRDGQLLPAEWVLRVRHGGRVILERAGRPGHAMRAYLDHAAARARRAAEEHRMAQPKGTLARLSEKQIRVLTRYCGLTLEQIDRMPRGQALARLTRQLERYYAGVDR